MYVRNEVEKSMNKTLGSDIQTAQMLVDTYIIIIKSDTVLNEVCKKLYEQGIYTYDAERLRKSISASSINSTEVFQVFVRNDDLSTTHIIANMIATVAPSIIQDFVEASSVKVVDYAVKGKMVSPNVNKNMFLSLVIGLFVGCMLVIIREIFDTRVKTEDELVDWFKLPILGVIPDIDESKSHKAGYLYKGSAYGNQKEGY